MSLIHNPCCSLTPSSLEKHQIYPTRHFYKFVHFTHKFAQKKTLLLCINVDDLPEMRWRDMKTCRYSKEACHPLIVPEIAYKLSAYL